MADTSAALATETEARDVAQPARESEWSGPRFLFGIIRWMRMDQIETKAPQKEFANEARTRPLAFARGFGDVARFLLGSECW